MLGHGTTILFDSGFFASIQSITFSGVERAAIPNWHFGTTGGKTFEPADTYDPGELVVECIYDATEIPPILGNAETVTITPAGGADAISFSGFMTGHDINIVSEETIRSTSRLKASGLVTWTTP
jgi:hypothetical protein